MNFASRSIFLCAMCFAAVSASLAGCNKLDVPMQTTYKVTGRVILDGQPAAGVDVRFIPKDKSNFKLEETPLGHTDTSGNFTLTTYFTGDGAPAGEYMVAIAYPDQLPVDEEADETEAAIAQAKDRKAKGKNSKPRFPPIYQVPQKSGLTAIVPEGGGELPPFELTSRKK